MQHYYSDQEDLDTPVENPSVFAELLNSPLAQVSATKGQRFLNYVIDGIAFYMLCFMVGIVVAVIDPALLDGVDGLLGRLLFMVLSAVYYFVLEASTGRTLGKVVTRTRVVMEDGSPLTTKAVLYRSLSRLIPFEGFSFLGEGVGLHDRYSHTRVVKVD